MKPQCRLLPSHSLLLAFLVFKHCQSDPGVATPDQQDDRTSTFDEAYARGKEAYLDNRWPECVSEITRALDSHKRHLHEVAQCRQRCHREAEAQPLLLADGPLAFYERTIRDTLCLMQCQKQPVAHRDAAATLRSVQREFEDKTPYDYLQLCYFKMNDLQNAASCAYTFLLHNPEHDAMQANFRYYTSQPDIDVQTIKNLEIVPYQELFLKGNEAYNNKNYQEVTEFFEAALIKYFAAEEECRLLCEGNFEKAPALDLTMTIANHFTFSLRCKQHCPTVLSYMYGRVYEDFLPSHFHYLQYAYFQNGEVAKACETAASFLLFHPNNDTMLHNIEFYKTTQTGIGQENFMPRKEVVEYVHRDAQEKILLAFVEDNFKVAATETDHLQDNILENAVISQMKNDSPNANNQTTETPLLMAEQQLNGTKRFMTDGITDENECQQLMTLTTMSKNNTLWDLLQKMHNQILPHIVKLLQTNSSLAHTYFQEAAVHGDGYNGRPTPHTKFETFEGLTVGRAAVLLKMGYLTKERVQLFLDLSERSRRFVEKYFKLRKYSLFFSYTHLVCRTATPDSPLNRSDLSHPVHADNCILTNDGKCLKNKPAFTWRDYSAILYLNDDFEGGDFIFAANKTLIQATVRPKCGRMVGFSAGEENLHGVQAVLKGRRCALAMWFTLDHEHREKERFLAVQLLEKVEQINEAEFEEGGRRAAETPQILFGLIPEDPNTAYQLDQPHGYQEVQEHVHDDL